MNKHLHNSKKSCNFAGIFMQNKAELTNKQQNIMKRNIFRVSLWCGICMAMTLVGCKADVDLGNIDTTTKVEANLALPIGSVTARIDDFLGDSTLGICLENGVLTMKDTITWVRSFHNVNLSQYISRKTLRMKVYDKLEGLPLFSNGKITGNDKYIIPLEFPLTLQLKGINNDEDYQRLDSVLIENASFTSTISRTNLPLEWDWIEEVTIKLGTEFHRPKGNVVTVYKKGQPNPYGYDQDIPITVDEFSMNLMKNDTLNPDDPNDADKYVQNNVKDTCNFLITMYIKIPSSAGQITIPNDATFEYNLGVQFIDYYAVWGMFKASQDMRDENEIVLAEEWNGYSMLNNIRLPLADPSIDVSITTKIAGALMLVGDYLYVTGTNGERVNATFDRGSTTLYKDFNPNEYLPLNSTIGDSATMYLLFDKDPSRGHIDQFFTVHPEKIGYKYSLDFNRQRTPQIRISNDADIRLEAAYRIPFMFNEGVSVEYTDTLENIDLSQIVLDSLLADVAIIDTIEEAKLKLALGLENTIPLQFTCVLTCLDSIGNIVMDPYDGTKPFRITGEDTIVIPSPTFEQDINLNWISKPNKSTQIITVDKETTTVLSQIKRMELKLALNDKSLSGAYDKGLPNIKLTDQQGLRISIGIGADVKALLNLEGINQPTDSNEEQQ